MRKFITTAFLLTFCACVAHAADTDCTTLSKETCNATPGCYWQTNSTSCTKCPVGTYNDGTLDENANDCFSCGIWDANSNTKWSQTATGQTSQDACAFTAQCQAAQAFTNDNFRGCYACSLKNNASTGTYYYGTRESEYTINGTWGDISSAVNTTTACAECGANSTTSSNGLGCDCQPNYHTIDGTNSDTDANGKECVINKYYIRYYCNSDDSSPTKEIEIEYGGEHYILPSNTCQKTGYTFNGWLEETSNTTYTNETSLIVDQDYDFKAQWAGKEFKVNYSGNENTAGNAPDKPTTCTYDTPCNAPDNTYMRAGYIFANKWSCQYMPQAGQNLQPCCKTINSMGFDTGTCEISPGTDISTISDGNDIILTAIWESCPNGYYCPGTNSDPKTEQKKCPAGSTSAATSTAITQCYMVGGTTQICDKNNKCFTLPAAAVGNIFYHGTTQ